MLSRFRSFAQFVIVVALALLMVGCVDAQPKYDSLQAAHDFVSSHQTSPVLAPGDSVSMAVIGEDDLSGPYTVSQNGVLSLPLVGDVPVVGLTAESAANVIKAAYQKGYLLNPQVTLQKILPPAVFVMGAVRTPGSYPYTSSTVMKAASLAGGFNINANMKRFDVVRDGRLIQADPTTPVLPHDVIIVDESRQP